MNPDDTISLRFRPEQSQAPDYTIGFRHQRYENHRMIFDKSWDKYYFWGRIKSSVVSGAIAAIVYAITLPWFPSVWSVVGFWVFAPAPLVALLVWFVHWRKEKFDDDLYYKTFVPWIIYNETLYSAHYDVQIGPKGYVQTTKTDHIELSWARYHLAVLQPDNLILVFHGTVAVIPKKILPIDPMDLLDRINHWIIEEQKDLLPIRDFDSLQQG